MLKFLCETWDLVMASPGRFPTLHGVMMRLGQAGKPMTARQIGNRFRGLKNNRIAGLMVKEAGEKNHTTLWAVQAEASRDDDRGNGISGSTGSESLLNAEGLHSDSDIIMNSTNGKAYRGGRSRHPVHPEIPSNGIEPDWTNQDPRFDWGPAY